jgi:predicted  nucleic acid-binding Zn-ribbon protein
MTTQDRPIKRLEKLNNDMTDAKERLSFWRSQIPDNVSRHIKEIEREIRELRPRIKQAQTVVMTEKYRRLAEHSKEANNAS